MASQPIFWSTCSARQGRRRGALERVQLLLEDWQLTGERIGQAEQRMTGVLHELGLTGLVTSITSLSPVGARRRSWPRPAWRAVWGAQRGNPVYRDRYQYLTSRDQNRLTPTQAQTVIAAAILRHLHAVITTGQAWDPLTAAHSLRQANAALAA